MDVKSVFKNIKKKGLRNTWQSYQKRRAKRKADAEKRLREKNMEELLNNVDWNNIEEQKKNLSKLVFYLTFYLPADSTTELSKQELEKRLNNLFDVFLVSEKKDIIKHLMRLFIELNEFQSMTYEKMLTVIDLLQRLFIELNEFQSMTCEKVLAVIDLLQLVFTNENDDSTNDVAVRLVNRILSGQDYAQLTNIEIARLCIKYIYPTVYGIAAQKSIEKKLYFMQPRKGLNESFRYFYRKLQKNYPSYQLKLYEFQRDTVSLQEYYVNALFFMRDMATAYAVFVHESNNLMGHLDIRTETKIVQLWHGCGVFKHIGLSTADKKGFKSGARYEEFPEYNKYSLVTIASPELSWVFEEFMGISRDSGIIQPLGVCRTDEFFNEGYRDKCFEKLYKKIPAAKNKKVILYAPTYRGLDPNRVSPDKLDIEKFAQELGDKYILIMKHHQTVKEVPLIPELYRDKFAYDMTRGRGMNINELMTVADICITDYSSVAFEFSLFERPLLFFVYDMDEYIDNRGLYYDFEEITPGPLCRTNEEMIAYIKDLEKGFDNTEIVDFKNKFMCSCDGNASERVIQYLKLEKDR